MKPRRPRPLRRQAAQQRPEPTRRWARQDARAARAARLGELRRRTADAHSITVGAYLDLWLSRKRGLRESTRTSYRYHLDHYLIPRMGSLRLVELERNPDHIVNGKPLSPATRRWWRAM